MSNRRKVTVQFLRRGQFCYIRVLWQSRFIEVIKVSMKGYERAKRKARAMFGETVTMGTFHGQLELVLEFVATIDTFADEFRRHEVMR